MQNTQSTIAAISTAIGEGAIAIVRLSGPNALAVTLSVFKSREKVKSFEPRKIYHGWIYDKEEPIDEVIITFFQSPNSYTGEDIIEINCHGGVFVSRRILDLCIANGATAAKPGEFTQRAFLNKKLDLAQAEAVADIIHSKTEASRRVAVYHLEGHLSKYIHEMRKELIHFCSLLEVELDFAEEEVEFASRDDLKSLLQRLIKSIHKIIASYERGYVCREGIRLAIIGRPNVGKSSLLNALLERERAIVTDIPGTTRDTLEEVLDIEGVLFRIIDTAGIRETEDPVEKEGVNRARQAAENADLILLVLDVSQSIDKEDEALIHWSHNADCPVIVAFNKWDLKKNADPDQIIQKYSFQHVSPVSALKGQGIPELIEVLKNKAVAGEFPHEGEVLLTRARHKEAMENAADYLSKALDALLESMSAEFIAFDVRSAMNALSEITGDMTPDDILNYIFDEFCIGK